MGSVSAGASGYVGIVSRSTSAVTRFVSFLVAFMSVSDGFYSSESAE
jgi:hypothetical protein